MIRSRTLVTSLLFGALFSSLGTAQDLSKYRDFQFGMRLESVAKQIHMNASAAKTTHQRPAVIQTLQWDQLSSYSDPAAEDRSLRSIRFDFYNGELFKMVVTYDPVRIEGLTTEDMVDAISAIYGPATKPERTIAISAFSPYQDSQKVLACWEDAQYSYNLFRSPYGNAFGLIAISKQLDLVAADASREGERLDKQEAPAKEVARQMKQEEDKRVAQEKARLVSKPKFRP